LSIEIAFQYAEVMEMNINKILPVFGLVFSALIMLFANPVVHGEVRSGFWTHVGPSADSIGSNVDFSVLTPFCQTEGGAQLCSLKVTDCFFKNDTVFAPNGIYFDSSISADLQTQFIMGKTISRTGSEELFYLDSMMKKIALKAPQATYGMWIYLRGGIGAFFVKTSENRFAFMIQTGMYIGGIDRIWYYWAYQPDSGLVLFKNRIFQQPTALMITADAFSGRPNPIFRLTDSAAIAAITHQIYVSVDTFVNATAKRIDAAECPNGLGYRKLSVYGMIEPENPVSSYMPTIDICGGNITYFKVPPQTSSMPPLYFHDKNSSLEKLIIRIGCEKNLTTTDSYGAIKFCDLVPDSLKPGVSIMNKMVNFQRTIPAVRCRVRGHELHFQSVPSGLSHIECFNLSGLCLAKTMRETGGEGNFSIDFSQYAIGPGAYIVTFFHVGTNSRSMIFPVFIYR